MKIKKGDDVVIIAGKDKGKAGKVIAVDRNRDRVTVEGANLMKKNTKADAQGKGGGVVTTEAPLHVSNVALVEGGKPVRTGSQLKDDGTKVRISRRSGKEI
ncbi:MAG TPA: 50S ribosomal protein L24 [Streptosporangiaceae bacterium]|jgi:large subunit ribosomal protein L24|nr:ribosomal protein [Actinomycetes bacterium]HXA61250.1 50S ribosomal protein L24 [Streptosporangiaceae bacterium]